MTLLTALEIANNYPENISIVTFRDNDNGKFGGYVYRMKDGEIHKLLLSHSQGIYSSRKAVKIELKTLLQDIKEKYNGNASTMQ